jgi:hypothetical protein
MAISGKKTVTTAGTQVRLSDISIISPLRYSPLAIKALSTNTGLIYIGDLNVSSADGFQLSASEVIILEDVGDLMNMWIDSAVNGEGVTWLMLSS